MQPPNQPLQRTRSRTEALGVIAARRATLVYCPTNSWTTSSGSTMLRECRDQPPHYNSKQPMQSSCGSGCLPSVRRSKWR